VRAVSSGIERDRWTWRDELLDSSFEIRATFAVSPLLSPESRALSSES